MTGYSVKRQLAEIKYWMLVTWRRALIARIQYSILLVIPILYLLTLAQGLVLGDPTEYTFVAYVLGIAHPPGYAFITLVGKLFQTLNPFGDVPWRMHLLSATAATLASLFVYGTVRAVAQSYQAHRFTTEAVALFAALTVATGVNFWQHAIHTNPHMITAAFLAANLFLLTKWWQGSGGAGERGNRGAGEQASDYVCTSVHRNDRWLHVFCLSAGLGVTHHPLTVFSFPAYALFILWVRPSIWRDGRRLIKMVAFALLGLSVWLYFPIRSAMQPVFGPHDMYTLQGFRNVVLAEGLRVNLFHFGLADQLDRALVFWSLLRLQYSLPVVALALIGLAFLAGLLQGRAQDGKEGKGPVYSALRPLFLLYALNFLLNYTFIMNTVQDVMAYLLGPFLIVGLAAGVGLFALLHLMRRRLRLERSALPALLAGALFLLGPALQTARNLPQVSLRHYDEGQRYVAAVFDWFAGRHEGAVLLNDWEHMTPLWYTRFVESRWPDPADVRPEFVSTARPWLQLVFDYLPGGPVYLSGYQPDIVNAGFRLRPRGPFYQVVEPGEETLPPELMPLNPLVAADELEVVGYLLPEREVTAGAFVPFTLAMRAPDGANDYYVPVLRVGEMTFTFTTDSHLVTLQWQPGEVIVERFDFALPHHLPEGNYPVTLSIKNLSANRESDLSLSLGELAVSGQTHALRIGHLLANFRQRIGLVSARVNSGLQRRTAPWDKPLQVRPGDTIHLGLQWQSLAPAEDSYTVFVHLIDLDNRPWVDDLDYTPLGGAAPTHLWIPKWLPGQRYIDPYRLQIPPQLPAGAYLIEVGLYEMRSHRRLHISDPAGDLIGDRYILGQVMVQD